MVVQNEAFNQETKNKIIFFLFSPLTFPSAQRKDKNNKSPYLEFNSLIEKKPVS